MVISCGTAKYHPGSADKFSSLIFHQDTPAAAVERLENITLHSSIFHHHKNRDNRLAQSVQNRRHQMGVKMRSRGAGRGPIFCAASHLSYSRHLQRRNQLVHIASEMPSYRVFMHCSSCHPPKSCLLEKHSSVNKAPKSHDKNANKSALSNHGRKVHY